MSHPQFRFARARRLDRVALSAVCAVAAVGVGCAGGVAPEVSPSEIPVLEARLADTPNDADLLLRYSAALYTAGQCDSATVIARRGMTLQPSKALGPLVVGQCMEAAEAYDDAIEVYTGFLASYPDARGSDAVRAQETAARRDRALVTARRALAQEDELAQTPAEPTTVAVLPVVIVGDPQYEPLSRGLAEILTTDLALLERFRMVERLQVGALLEEMNLSQTGRVDENTAVRVGNMLRAGRMVQGMATIPPDGTTRLEASVLLSTGEVTTAAAQEGRVRDLLRLEKAVVVDIAEQMGYQLSEAERRAIMENGTQNLVAFLAYSNGLEAEDRGDLQAASMFYGQAVRADPNFRQARQGYQSSSAGAASQSAGSVTTAATTPSAAPATASDTPLGAPLSATVVDVAAIQADVAIQTATPSAATTSTGTTTSASQPPSTITVVGPPPTVAGVVRIFFILP